MANKKKNAFAGKKSGKASGAGLKPSPKPTPAKMMPGGGNNG